MLYPWFLSFYVRVGRTSTVRLQINLKSSLIVIPYIRSPLYFTLKKFLRQVTSFFTSLSSFCPPTISDKFSITFHFFTRLVCPVGYNEFAFFRQWRIQTLWWVQTWNLRNIYKIRFLIFWAVFCAFGFKVWKSGNMTQKNFFRQKFKKISTNPEFPADYESVKKL